MSKFRDLATVALTAVLLLPGVAHSSGDAAKGEAVFKKCAACHAVGDGARNKVGPQLNDVFGRVAGGLAGFNYSPAMVQAGQGGLIWDEATLDQYLHTPKDMIPKTRMVFAGLAKEDERANLIAYLRGFSAQAAAATEPASPVVASSPSNDAAPTAPVAPATADPAWQPSTGAFKLGRVALTEEVAAWDIDVRPDGLGLPDGRGTVAEGEPIYIEQCAICHGDFGEGRDRWPVLAGGQDSLKDERPEKTIGSYWPYLSTVWDYVHRAMPFGNARSLSNDDIYAITAYLLYLNDVVTDDTFELSRENFAEVRLPNEANFIPDNRYEEPHWTGAAEPCMTNCKPDPATVTMRAQVLDVTPDGEDDGGLSIE
jgi:cytochrome c